MAKAVVLAASRQLQDRAREYDIDDLGALYASPAFSAAGFDLDAVQQAVLLAR